MERRCPYWAGNTTADVFSGIAFMFGHDIPDPVQSRYKEALRVLAYFFSQSEDKFLPSSSAIEI
jgi:hypothetical protein